MQFLGGAVVQPAQNELIPVAVQARRFNIQNAHAHALEIEIPKGALNDVFIKKFHDVFHVPIIPLYVAHVSSNEEFVYIKLTALVSGLYPVPSSLSWGKI